MRFATLLAVVAALFPAVGCQRVEPSADVASPPSELFGRLEAASTIVDSGDRDEALSHVIADAAASGNVEVVLEAVQGIVDRNYRDNAAHGAAVVLAQAGKTSEATQVARMIVSTSLRDDALARIASGK